MRPLFDPAERERRRALLDHPRTRPLAAMAEALRREGRGAVPDADPLDGGCEARVLLLLEKPGPGAAASGFVSRDNDAPTSRAIARFLEEAGLPREETLLWNLVPWWNCAIAVRAEEERAGAARLPELLALLPRLCGVLLVGARAARRAASLRALGLETAASAHPSPQVRAAFPERWRAIPEVWAGARRWLAQPTRILPRAPRVGAAEGGPPMTDIASQIAEHMEIVGSCGNHVGTVDRVEGDRIKLTRKDSPDGGHHYLPLDAVTGVCQGKVWTRKSHLAALAELAPG